MYKLILEDHLVFRHGSLLTKFQGGREWMCACVFDEGWVVVASIPPPNTVSILLQGMDRLSYQQLTNHPLILLSPNPPPSPQLPTTAKEGAG